MSMNLEFFKTLVSGLKKSINEKIDSSKADWNDMDENSPNYVKNRTHWKEVVDIVGKEYWVYLNSQNKIETHSPIPLVVGQKWMVTSHTEKNGSVNDTYHLEAKELEDGSPCLSPYDNATSFSEYFYPFILTQTQHKSDGVWTGRYQNSWLKIVGKESAVSYHKLEEGYLPSSAFSQSNSPVRFGVNDEGGFIKSASVSGTNTTANASNSHAEGANTTASGDGSHAEGTNTTASGNGSHAEGSNTTASRTGSHAEGSNTTSSGFDSHAEGRNTTASGWYSHAQGYYTKAACEYESVSGMFNKYAGNYISVKSTAAQSTVSNTSYAYLGFTFDEDTGKYTVFGGANYPHNSLVGTYSYRSSNWIFYYESVASTSDSSTTYNMISYQSYNSYGKKGAYAHIVGNGTSDTARSNAHTLAWDGTAWFAGDVYVGSTSGTDKDEGSKRLVTETDLVEGTTNCLKTTGGTYDLSDVLVLKKSSNTYYSDTIFAIESNPITVGDNEFIYKTCCAESGFRLSRETEAIPDYQSTIINPNIWQMFDNHTDGDHMRLYVRPSSIQFQRYDNGYKTFYLQAEKDRTKIYNDQKLIDFAESRLSNVATPTEDNDVANKAYVDAHIIASSTPGSTKKFRITVDDSGTISATEVAES